MVGVSGRSGGARIGSGGARPGAGRPRKHPLIELPHKPMEGKCPCGAEIVQSQGRGRLKKYCSTACRKAEYYGYQAPTEQAACKQCGNAVTKFFRSGKPGKFCQLCMDAQRGVGRPKLTGEPKPCAHCGSEFIAIRVHQKYCRDACRYVAAERAKGVRPMAYVKICACLNCKRNFKPKTTAYSTYCSRECAFEHKAATPFSSIWAGYCATCAMPYVARRKKKYCSEECQPKRQYVSVAPAIKLCRRCGHEYEPERTGGRHGAYCSVACSALVAAAAKRIQKAKRRRILRHVTVERVDPFVVFDRDGWRCQLCGVKTPRSKRGTCDDDAPELDHIIPLSREGKHSYLNTQCACRKCNGAKADRPLGQLLLIA